MREYKFYRIKADGHITGPAVVHELPDDSAALIEARTLAMGGDVEIWQGARLVAYVVSDVTKQSPPPAETPADRHR